MDIHAKLKHLLLYTASIIGIACLVCLLFILLTVFDIVQSDKAASLNRKRASEYTVMTEKCRYEYVEARKNAEEKRLEVEEARLNYFLKQMGGR